MRACTIHLAARALPGLGFSGLFLIVVLGGACEDQTVITGTDNPNPTGPMQPSIGTSEPSKNPTLTDPAQPTTEPTVERPGEAGFPASPTPQLHDPTTDQIVAPDPTIGEDDPPDLPPDPVSPPPETPTTEPPTPPIPPPTGTFDPTLKVEGFGSATVGGRGGKVFLVTTLEDSGEGSLRTCVEASGPRYCLFRTGGTIVLQKRLSIEDPFITIAGQTAPGGGITLRTANGGDTLAIMTSEVILSYLTLRPGPGGENHGAELCRNKNLLNNLVLDHLSLSWGTDEVLETWYAVEHVTIQWSLIAEALDCSTHPKGCHSKGVMLGGPRKGEDSEEPGGKLISFHHNLMAHNGERNPLVKTAGLATVINNVVYNPYWTFSHVDMEHQLVPVLANYLGNVFIEGPDSEGGKYGIHICNKTPLGAEIYQTDNLLLRKKGTTLTGQDVVDPDARPYLVATPHPGDSTTVDAANATLELVAREAGNSAALACDGTWYQRRDAIDTRIVESVTSRSGAIIDDPSDVGGWLAVDPGTPCPDEDADGLPDAYEALHGQAKLEEYLAGK